MGKKEIKNFTLLVLAVFLLLTPFNSRAAQALLMDTFVEIIVKDNLPDKNAILRDVTKLMEGLEEKFNYYNPSSELSKINHIEPRDWAMVSKDMFKVLVLAKEIEARTGGAFDIARGTGKWKIDKKTGRFFRDSRDVKLDLGGIAKGSIVDAAAVFLKEKGVRNAMINAGGDLYCFGDANRKGSEWNIGVNSPREPGKTIASFHVSNKGVATSGGYERPGHIIDPRTGNAASTNVISATVVSKNCATADALATALYVLDSAEGISIVESIVETECLLISDDGSIHVSDGFKRMGLTKTER